MPRPMTRDELLRIDRVPVINQGQRRAVLGPPGSRLITVEVPQLAKLPPYHTARVTCHAGIADQLQRAFALLQQLGLLGHVLTYDGCYNDRQKVSGGSASTHAWGAAIDLNAQWNAYGMQPAAKGSKGSLWEVVGVFEACGFAWGGFWRTPDGMHFEVARLLAADELPVLAANPQPADVAPWASDAVDRVLASGLMGRDTDGRFRGPDPVTRQELAVVLDRLAQR